MALILRLSLAGQPMGWIPWQYAVTLYSKNQVAWVLGEKTLRFYGGYSRCRNARSFMDVHPIVATKGRVVGNRFEIVPPLTNASLFRRDRHTCLYCLAELPDRHLTRDHVVPLSRGGQDTWCNVVTACRGCNQRKADQLIEEISMQLHAMPYVPNYAEWLILRNRHIMADQMEFLSAHRSKNPN